jgi:hypothetical protein
MRSFYPLLKWSRCRQYVELRCRINHPYGILRQRPSATSENYASAARYPSRGPLPTLGPWPLYLFAPSPPTSVCYRQITLPPTSLACAIPRNTKACKRKRAPNLLVQPMIYRPNLQSNLFRLRNARSTWLRLL